MCNHPNCSCSFNDLFNKTTICSKCSKFPCCCYPQLYNQGCQLCFKNPCCCIKVIKPCPPPPPPTVCVPCPKIIFKDTPKVDTWNKNVETTLFEESVPVFSCRLITVDVLITAEFLSSAHTLFNIYRLYINDKEVVRTSVETDGSEREPNIIPAVLIWAGKANGCKNVRVKVTTFLKEQLTSPTNRSGNVNNGIGFFAGGKGAFLRIRSE